MPTFTRWFIKSGMIWFLLAMMAAVLMELDLPELPPLIPLFWHALMVGWITQIIMGVSLWMFPGRKRSEALRDQLKPWSAFWLLNTGLILRFISEPFVVPGRLLPGVVLILSVILQLSAGAVYVWEMWPRIQSKAKRRQQRAKRKPD
jgi:hypothetical protein